MRGFPAPCYTFDNHHEGEAFIRQHKPPAGMFWGINQIQIGEEEYSEAVEVRAVEKWPIDHLNPVTTLARPLSVGGYGGHVNDDDPSDGYDLDIDLDPLP